MSNEELKRIYNLFTDCWRFYKKYNNDKFAIALALATVEKFERRAKEIRENAEI